jgi:hypothetical protein
MSLAMAPPMVTNLAGSDRHEVAPRHDHSEQLVKVRSSAHPDRVRGTIEHRIGGAPEEADHGAATVLCSIAVATAETTNEHTAFAGFLQRRRHLGRQGVNDVGN